MKKQKNTEKVAEIITTARKLSALVIEQEAKSDISRSNLEHIASVAELLVASPHPVEPGYDNVLERGNVIYPRFPARQTLKNRYRMLIAVWRGAYHNILHLLAEETMQKAMNQPIPSGRGSDAGATIQALREYIVRIRVENDELRHDLTAAKSKLSATQNDNRPKQNGKHGLDGEIVAFLPAKKWLLQLSSPDSLLEEDVTGLRLSKLARPGRLIMDSKVLAVIRSL